jgi:hypothetical protein
MRCLTPLSAIFQNETTTKDDFNFSIVNFPLISSNIPAAPANGVYISQLILYFRADSKSREKRLKISKR